MASCVLESHGLSLGAGLLRQGWWSPRRWAGAVALNARCPHLRIEIWGTRICADACVRLRTWLSGALESQARGVVSSCQLKARSGTKTERKVATTMARVASASLSFTYQGKKLSTRRLMKVKVRA